MKLTGKEFFLVTGMDDVSRPCGQAEQITTGDVAALAGLSSWVRIISSGTSDTVLSTDTTIGWNSATTSVKTQTIPAPTGSGRTLAIVDIYGTLNPGSGAGTYNINITPAAGLVAGSSSFPINIDGNSISIRDMSASIGWIPI